ncbi:MAG: hypothetical protein CME06_03065 [Gemmatimonadetes bacterium]|nr:hypothetical protein [Gemmatimonadota bacterium]
MALQIHIEGAGRSLELASSDTVPLGVDRIAMLMIGLAQSLGDDPRDQPDASDLYRRSYVAVRDIASQRPLGREERRLWDEAKCVMQERLD